MLNVLELNNDFKKMYKNNLIKLYGKNSEKAEEAQRALNKAVRQAQIDEAAVQILDASDKLKELTYGTEDYIKELENQAKAFNEAFGTDVGSTFVEQFQDLISYIIELHLLNQLHMRKYTLQ